MDRILGLFRPLVVEDFAGQNAVLAPTTTDAVTVAIMGVGSIPVTPFIAAADDTAAEVQGIPLGGVYIHTAGPAIYLAVALAQPASTPGGYGAGPYGTQPYGN